MDLRTDFETFLLSDAVERSNKAPSYVRAIDLLDSILQRKQPSSMLAPGGIWHTTSVKNIQALYELVREQQRLGTSGMFNAEKPISYWRDGFCSAALKSYKEFLIIREHRTELWALYQSPGIAPDELGQRLEKKRFNRISELAEDKDFDFSSIQGRDVRRIKKTRVNQDFFRDMILLDYGAKCCITGLNVPEVLRASHITRWADEPANRMNPANGLCLSATYDAAFDKHLISFDDDYRMVLGPNLKEYYSNKAFKAYFLSFEGQPIYRPKRFCPDRSFLEKHRQKTFA